MPTAGVIGAFLIIVALSIRSSFIKWLFLAFGLFICFMSESRASLLALAIVLALNVLSRTSKTSHFIKRHRLVAWTSFIVVGSFVAFVVMNNLNGRLEIWNAYGGVISRSGVFGIGTAGISDLLVSGQFPSSGGHAHNLFLDLLIRNGFVCLSIGAIIIGLQFIQVARIRKLCLLPLSLSLLVVAIGFFEVSISWQNLSFELWLLMFAFILANRLLTMRSNSFK